MAGREGRLRTMASLSEGRMGGKSKGCTEGKCSTDGGCFIKWILLILRFVMVVLFSINGHDLTRYFCILLHVLQLGRASDIVKAVRNAHIQTWLPMNWN